MEHKKINERIKEWSKFTDEQLLDLHSLGYSDNKICKIFKCSSTSIRRRRTKLLLVANYKSFSGKIKNIEELKMERIQENKRSRKYITKENKRKYLNSIRKTPWIKEKMNKTRREYRNFRMSDEKRNKEKEYKKEYYQKNKREVKNE